MRWDNLFDDLESQLEHGLSAEEVDLQAEEERLRLGRLRLRDRLVALHAVGSGELDYAVKIGVVSGEVIVVRPAAFGRDWMSGEIVGDPDERSRRHPQFILPLSSIGTLHLSREQLRLSLAKQPAPVTPPLAERLGLPFVLRDLCRRRTAVEVMLPSGSLTGTIDRVGHDHLDIALHEPGSPRRESLLTGMRIVPFAQVMMVRI